MIIFSDNIKSDIVKEHNLCTELKNKINKCRIMIIKDNDNLTCQNHIS